MKKILLVDDEPSLTDILCQILKHLGFASDSAHSADAAISLIKRNNYWAFFCDLNLPGMNGLELFEELKNISKAQSRRFILFTGAALDDKTEEMVAGKQIVVCKKPFHLQNIKDTIRLLEASYELPSQNADAVL